MDNKIEVKKLYKKFDHFTLGENSFSIPKGYITGFIGKNGMGKTSTIKAILSLINYEGKIYVDGDDVKSLDYLQDVGIIMDDSFLSKDWTLNNVNDAMNIGYNNWQEDVFFDYLNRFGLEKDSKVKDLSRGMNIKLMLSIALSHKANLLILDEPTSGLDPSMRDELSDILQEFVADEDNTVLFSTHITQDLDRIADFIIFIDHGKIIFSDTKEAFQEKYIVVKGGIEDFDLLKDVEILGGKKLAHNFEALVERYKFNVDSDELVIEEPNIDRVMVLYGRSRIWVKLKRF